MAAYFAAITYLLFTVGGMALQVLKVERRRIEIARGELEGEFATQTMEPVRYFLFYAAYAAFFLIGISRPQFDHVLVWTRMPVILLTAWLLFRLYQDRWRSIRAKSVCFASLISTLLIILMLVCIPYTGREYLQGFALSADVLTGVITVLLVVVNVHQAWRIVDEGTTGGIAISREVGTTLKDGGGIWYALTAENELIMVAIMHAVNLLSLAVVIIAYSKVGSTARGSFQSEI